MSLFSSFWQKKTETKAQVKREYSDGSSDTTSGSYSVTVTKMDARTALQMERIALERERIAANERRMLQYAKEREEAHKMLAALFPELCNEDGEFDKDKLISSSRPLPPE